jgi:hypothetical protein
VREVLEPDVTLDHGLDLREPQRRHVVDELRELGDVRVGQQVGPRGEQLPELHEGRPLLLERLAEAHRVLDRRGPAADDADLAQHAQ